MGEKPPPAPHAETQLGQRVQSFVKWRLRSRLCNINTDKGRIAVRNDGRGGQIIQIGPTSKAQILNDNKENSVVSKTECKAPSHRFLPYKLKMAQAHPGVRTWSNHTPNLSTMPCFSP